MTEQPPPTDGQRAAEIRRLFQDLLLACNQAADAGLDIDIEMSRLTRAFSGSRFHTGNVKIKREVA